jgi:hypothetical protein
LSCPKNNHQRPTNWNCSIQRTRYRRTLTTVSAVRTSPSAFARPTKGPACVAPKKDERGEGPAGGNWQRDIRGTRNRKETARRVH